MVQIVATDCTDNTGGFFICHDGTNLHEWLLRNGTRIATDGRIHDGYLNFDDHDLSVISVLSVAPFPGCIATIRVNSWLPLKPKTLLCHLRR